MGQRMLRSMLTVEEASILCSVHAIMTQHNLEQPWEHVLAVHEDMLVCTSSAMLLLSLKGILGSVLPLLVQLPTGLAPHLPETVQNVRTPLAAWCKACLCALSEAHA